MEVLLGNGHIHPEPLHQIILEIVKESDIDAESVPLDKFVSQPQENEERVIHFDQHENAET